MNPISRNIALNKKWKGLKSPWIGTINIWDLFYSVELLDEDIYKKIKVIKGSECTTEFANEVYKNIKKYKYFITNLDKIKEKLFEKKINGKVYKFYSIFYLV